MRGVLQSGKLGGDLLQCGTTVIVIRVHDSKGTVDHVLRAEHSVHRAERLDTLRRDHIALRKASRILKHVVDFQPGSSFNAIAEQLLHILQHGRLDNQNNVIKSGAKGVKDRILHEDLSSGSHPLHLLDAAVAGAETGRHDYQSFFAHNVFPHCFVSVFCGHTYHIIQTGESQPCSIPIWDCFFQGKHL